MSNESSFESGARKTGELIEASIALIFPGQGLPLNDIFKFYGAINDRSKGVVRQRLKEAERVVNISLVDILEKGDESPLKSTAVMQPVVYALSMAGLELVHNREEFASRIKFVAGHSLGEYAAITAAGVVSFEDGMRIVSKRGELMEEVSQRRPSRHIGIFGLSRIQVEIACEEIGINIDLLNAPGNHVIGCSAEKADEIIEFIRSRGATRVGVLSTSGAFHDPNFMSEAAAKFDEFISDFEFKDPKYEVIANTTGNPSKSGRALKAHAVESMLNPVRWADSIQFMNQQNVVFYEIGPGSVLTALNRQNNIPPARTKNIFALL